MSHVLFTHRCPKLFFSVYIYMHLSSGHTLIFLICSSDFLGIAAKKYMGYFSRTRCREGERKNQVLLWKYAQR